jgi:acyl carrier protein
MGDRMSDTRQRLQDVFCEVFNAPDLVLEDRWAASDVEGWDSLAHVDLIIAIEHAFGIRFATAEISHTKDADVNVGSLIRLIEKKVGGV